ncbi:MAG: leucine--tRNA ligase [Proteobacteria bacterium]|nr:leucine--tRNA ligase [Pseudomonadota bacterium]
MTTKYTPSQIEPKWQKTWFESNAFLAEVDTSRPKYYVLEMLPYPSGVMHMGHVRNYTLGDVLARYKRAQGFNVMHPMGWDAFGLPAENAAMKKKTHPKTWTLANIAEMKALMKQFGWSYDWSKEVTTCLPEYYGPQQALFLDLYGKGLVQRGETLVNWDPVDQTVLANEQVVDGKGWRSGAPVERRKMPQWVMRITKYADELLADLDKLPHWPARVRLMQENWLGKSRGLEFSFQVKAPSEFRIPNSELRVFTTRPDTIFGATFCCVAPEHPLAALAASNDDKARSFIADAESLGTAQETIDKAEKKGHKTSFTAIHPFTGAELPIYIANFVLMTYGTGALMAVPAHDERDHAFATKYQLPIVEVVSGGEDVQKAPHSGDGQLINSQFLNGMPTAEAINVVISRAEAEGWGRGVTQWRLRDWGISRQRYWGCPIPFIHCDKCGTVPVPREQLPVVLPEDVDITGSGNPLDKHPTWKHVSCPKCNGKAVRETDTMDTFMDSSWYYMRYLCPTSKQPLDKKAVDYWMGSGAAAPNSEFRIPNSASGVDQYIGGIEHAVLHLLYARFFTKALRDTGHVSCDEPFSALLCQGMLIGNAYQKADGTYLYPSQIELRDGKAFEKATGTEVKILPAEKISKSKNNGDSPEELLAKYGADTLRLFILFTAPPERDLEWSEAAIEGASRFLGRLWTLATTTATLPGERVEGFHNTPAEAAIRRKTHQTIQKVTQDIEKFQYNTMVAACMELLNTLTSLAASSFEAARREGVEALIRLLNPAVPHITEELWQMLSTNHESRITNHGPLHTQPWPKHDPALAAADEITLIVQVDGKLRARLTVPADISEEAALAAAHASPEAKPFLTGRQIAKQIYVPGRLVNIATRAL